MSFGRAWAGLHPAGAAACLEAGQAASELQTIRETVLQGCSGSLLALKVLFAPPVPLQQLSLGCGSTDEYLALAERLDRILTR